MGLVLSNVFIRGKIIATSDSSGISLPPVVTAVTPVASFTKSTSLVGNLISAIFTDTSTNTPTSWLWDFGDGVTSTSQNPTHLFESVGTFNTTLTATNAAGSNTSAAQSFTVLPPDLAPVASFTKNVSSGTVPFTVSFTDTSSNEPTSWLWDFGDGATSTSQSPTHEYATAGSFNVTLTATDAVGSNTSSAQAITATVPAPVSSFDMSVEYQGNLINATFADTSTNTPTSWLWNFGDGNTSTLQNPTHLFETEGTFTITLTATNAGGSTTSSAHYVTVEAVTYLNNRALLLKATGANASTNNIFVDSSTNALTVTRNGNVAQGSFSPFSPAGWSGRFNVSTTDTLTIPSNAAFAFGTGSFTIEFFANLADIATNQRFLIIGQSGTDAVVLGINAVNTLTVTVSNSTAITYTISSSFTNIWKHIALVRNSGTLTLYINGISVGSVANSSNITAQPCHIGGLTWAAGYNTHGLLSNLRIVKGAAVYTAAFTPPAAPLTTIAGTSLLTLQDNRVKDNSTNNFAITVTGTPKVVANSPFNRVAYSPVTHGGSMYFDGAGDYLTLPVSPALDLGTNACCIEAWVYLNNTSNLGLFCTQAGSAGQTRPNFIVSTNSFQIDYFGSVFFSGTISIPRLGWNHVAFTRSTSNGAWRFFLNGVLAGYTANGSQNLLQTTVPQQVGYYSGSPSSGYVADVRILNGAIPSEYATASTTTNTVVFSPPTAPLTAVANTQLLLKGTNSGIIDAATKNNLETVGSTQVSTTVKKYNTGSMKFNGSSDYIKVAPSIEFTMGTGDFTIECWAYKTAVNTPANGLFHISAGSHVPGSIANSIALGSLDTSTWQVYANGTNLSVSPAIPPILNTWQHFALVRSSGVSKLFLNGVSVYSFADTTNYTGTYLAIGAIYGTTTGYVWNGYIEDFRVTKSALYSSTFTPPTLTTSVKTDVNDPYFNQNALVLKTSGVNNAQNNTFIDSSTNALTVTRNGNVSQGSFSPFSPNGWSTNVSSGNHLTVPVTPVGTNWTIEGWVNLQSSAFKQCLVNFYPHTTLAISLNRTGLGETYIYIGNGSSWLTNISSGTLQPIKLFEWTHVALVRNGGTITLYHNGIAVVSTTTLPSGFSGGCVIGNTVQSVEPLTGNISNFRISTAAVYTANFTPPTAPLTAIAGTSLLTCQDNRFKDNSTNNFALTAVGTPKVVNNSPFAVSTAHSPATHGGSMYFYNSSDNLTIANNSNFVFGTGPYTVELWLYMPSYANGYNRLVDIGQSSGSWGLQVNNTGAIAVTKYGSADVVVSSPRLNLNSWNHIAVVRTSTATNSSTIYLNGVNILTFTDANAWNVSTGLIRFSGISEVTSFIKGYISDARIIKGTALYSTNFTVPTAPLTAVENTQLLLKGTNSSIYDASSHLPIETVGTAKVSTTQSKFGGASMYFDGTAGCYAKLPAGSLNFGTKDFTIDFWYYKSVQASAFAPLFYGGDSVNPNATFNISDDAGTLVTYISSDGASWNVSLRHNGGVLALAVWNHVVIRRVGSVFSLYLNGVLTNTFTSTASLYYAASNTPCIGGMSSRVINGYIDDFRITIGKGRYTVEPTAALS